MNKQFRRFTILHAENTMEKIKPCGENAVLYRRTMKDFIKQVVVANDGRR
jgi:hypothetical protein